MPHKAGRRMVLYLYVAVFVTRIGFGAVTIIFPLYLPATSLQVGIILALYPISEAISAIPVGRIADRFSRKNLHIIGMVLITGLTAAIGFTRNLYSIAILHAFMGVSAATAAVTSLTLLGDATKSTNRGKSMGGFDLANLGGYGLGFGLGSFLVNEFSNERLSWAFWVTSALFLMAGLMAAKLLDEPVKIEVLSHTVTRPRKVGARLRPILPVWLAQTVILGMYFLLPKAFRDAAFIPTRDTMIFLGELGGLFALGAIVFGHISDRAGRTRIMTIGALGELGFLVLFGWSFPNFTTYPVSIGLLACFFLASAIAPAILAYVSDISGRARRGSANALYSTVLSIGLAIGNILGGLVAELGGNGVSGIQWIFYAGAGILFPSIVATSTMLRRR